MRVVVGAGTICALFLFGCGRVPPQEAVNNIPIHDIVQRVKCELADALDEKLKRDDFAWMKRWTVAVDLTLEVNQQGGITPNGGYIQPMKNVLVTNTGPSSFSSNGSTTTSAIAQKFVFGASANLTGQAVRTEVLSFSLSLQELSRWRKELRYKLEHGIPTEDARGCDLPEGFDLDGTLRLAEWLDPSLQPVALRDLQPGFHPRPNVGAAKASTKGSGPSGVRSGLVPCDTADQARANNAADKAESYKDRVAAARKKANDAEKQATDTERQARQSGELTKRFKARAIAFARLAKKRAEATQRAADDAGSAIVSARAAAAETCDPDAAEANAKLAFENLKIAETDAEEAVQLAAYAEKNLSPDPPIDSMSQQIQFVVTTSASIAPTWLLVHWQGPSATSNLASVQGIRTHTLNITLGPPSGNSPTRALDIINSQNVVNAIRSLGGVP